MVTVEDPAPAFAATGAFTGPAAPVAAPGDADPFDIFGDAPEVPADPAASATGTDVEPGASGDPSAAGDGDRPPADVPETVAAPELDAAEAAEAPEEEAPTGAFTPETAGAFHLPARVTPATATVVAAVAQPSEDLSSMFDGPEGVAAPTAAEPERPGPGGDRAVVAATGTDFASRRAALEAARAASSAAPFTPAAAHATDTVTARYVNADRFYLAVDRLLALGQAGNPQLQAPAQRVRS